MDSFAKPDAVAGGQRSAASLGLLIGALTGGFWLATLIVVSLVNERGVGVLIGWEVLIPAGAAIAIAAPLAVLATPGGNHAEWFALSAGSSLGGMCGVSAFLFLAGFADLGPLIALVALGTLGAAAALWVAIAPAHHGHGYVLAALCALAVASFFPAWYAILTGGAGESGYFGQAILASPFGLGAGAGAWTFCALERLRARHFGRANRRLASASKIQPEK